MHQPGIEPGNPAWKADMLPLHHWSRKYSKILYQIKSQEPESNR